MPYSVPELPNEIVQQIFAVFATTLSTDEPALFPWFLGHICSTWRCIFLSMITEFWHDISIFLENDEYTVNIVRFFLERNTGTPLSFYVESPDDADDSSNPQGEDFMRQTMEMLADESMRWKNASICLGLQDLLPLIRVKNCLPLLQELDLDPQLFFEDDVPDQLYELFQNAPSLTVVTIGILGYWKFNLSNLKVFNVVLLGCGAPHFLAAFPHMRKLERLNLTYPSHHAMPSATIVLPNLRKLSSGDLRWLDLLKVPVLEDLSIMYDEYDSSDIVLSLLHRSSCNANISNLDLTRARAATTIEIIRHTPQITHLTLAHTPDIGNVFKQLTITTNSIQEPLGRHLQSLCLWDSFSSNDMSLLHDLISSRTIGGTANNRDYKELRELELGGPHLSQVAKKDTIALCKERGVQYIDGDDDDG